MAYAEGMCVEEDPAGSWDGRFFQGASSRWHRSQERPGSLGMGESCHGQTEKGWGGLGGILLSGGCSPNSPSLHPLMKSSVGRIKKSGLKIEVVVLRGGRNINLHLCCVAGGWGWFGVLFFPGFLAHPECAVGKRRDREPARPPPILGIFLWCRCGYITALSFLISILVQNSNNSPPSPR